MANYPRPLFWPNQENQLTNWSSYADAFETTYSYDQRDQLTGATHAQISGLTLPRAMPSSESYTFDGTGNRELSGTSTSTDGSHNQVQNDGTYTYTYDAEGNQTSRTEIATGEVTEYEFDYRNRLVRVTERTSAGGSATSIVEFQYDAFDRRTGKELDSDGDGDVDRAVAWAWDGDQVVLQYADADGDGPATWKLTNRYLYGEAIDQILADEQLPGDGIGLSAATLTTGEVLWPLSDHLGSVRDLVDSSGVVREHVVYDSFGNRQSESDYDSTGTPIASNHASAVDHLFGYTGREWDADVELQYNRARWYDPTQGRWISQDPIGFAAGDANLYRYVGNLPTTSTDPSGLQEGIPIVGPDGQPYDGPAIGQDPNPIPPWKVPFVVDPRSGELSDPTTYQWVVGNLYHRLGGRDIADGLWEFREDPLNAIWERTGPGFVCSMYDTVVYWGDIPDLEKQDLAAKSALGLVIGGGVRPPKLHSNVGTYPTSNAPAIQRTLPRSKHGVPEPDVNVPHTQIGRSSKSHGHEPQALEWMCDPQGRLVPTRHIDFTDHNYPEIHPYPHQHILLPRNPLDPVGGGLGRGPAQPLQFPNSQYPHTY